MGSGGIGNYRLFGKYKVQLLILQNILPIYFSFRIPLYLFLGRGFHLPGLRLWLAAEKRLTILPFTIFHGR